MAADAVAELEPAKSCCAVLKEKYLKLEERRNALRQAVKLLQDQVDKFQGENLSLKKAYQEERAQAESEREGKLKESSVRVRLENEISALKLEILSLQKKEGLGAKEEAGEVTVLRARVSEASVEIERLNKLLEEEGVRRDLERRKAEEGNKEASEKWKILNDEKMKTEEEKGLTGIRMNVAEEVVLLRTRVSESEAEINLLKDLVDKEKIRADLESKKAEAEHNKAAEAWEILKTGRSKNLEEKTISDIGRNGDEMVTLLQTRVSEGDSEIKRLKNLLEKEKKRIDSERKRVEAEKKKAAEAWKMVKYEKSKAEDEKRRADVERNRAEEITLHLKTLENEANEVRKKLVSEKPKFAEASRRLEMEKQIASREKKRADLEMAKAEEQKKCAEIERNKAADEKCRADKLSQQLEEEKRKNEKLHEILSVRKACSVQSGKSINNETSEIKVLKKELKLEKMKVKNAKRAVKLEKFSCSLVQQELYRLKQELTQFSHRLNILESPFLYRVEGKDDLAKMDNFFKMQNMNFKRKLSDLEHSRNDFVEALEGMDGYDHFEAGQKRIMPLDSMSGGSCSVPIPGISSELESLVGGSIRNKSHNSAMFYTSASFSDKQLVGSQGKGATSISTSAKLMEENSKQGSFVTGLSGGVNEMKSKGNLGVVAENGGRNPVHRKPEVPCLNYDVHEHVNVDGKVPKHRKRKRIKHAVESTGCLCMEDGKLHQQIEEEPSALHDIPNLKNNTPAVIHSQIDVITTGFEKGGCPNSKLQDDSYGNHFRSIENTRVSQKQNLAFQWCGSSGEQNWMGEYEAEGSENANVCNQAGPPATCSLTTVQACGVETVDSASGNQGSELYFEEMTGEDYMKLLELDNAIDEERYRVAMQMPMSPTIPKIGFPLRGSEVDKSKFSLEENFFKGLSNGEDDLVSSCSFDVIDVEINSNDRKINISASSYEPLLHEINGPVHAFEKRESNESGFCDAADVGKFYDYQNIDSGVEMEAVDPMPVPGNNKAEVPCARNIKLGQDNVPYYIVFSDTKDSSIILRIFCGIRNCMSQSSMIFQKDWVVQKIILAVAKEDLSNKEKACMFFSLLLYNFSLVTSVSGGSIISGDSILLLDSFVTHIKAVVTDVGTRCMFIELCGVDILLGLIEDFLISRRVLAYNNTLSEPLVPHVSGSYVFNLDGKTIYLSPKAADIDHLVAGSVALASICAAIDHIGFICEASYNILRVHVSDPSLVLRVLHIFAYICGKKYFQLRNYVLVMTTIKSIVMFLERGCASVGKLVSCPSFPIGSCAAFSKYAKCPFSEGSVSVDEVMFLLLENLQNQFVSETKHQLMESVNSSKCSALHHEERTGQDPENEELLYDLDRGCSASCCLYKFGKLAACQFNAASDTSLCYFSDILSLVELVACNMSWDWTCNNIIPQLLRMLESCVSEKFSVAILVLLGQLGRLGIKASGYEEMRIENLRCRLSTLLCQNTCGKWGLPTQLAAITALVSLQSLDFGDLIQSIPELPLAASQSDYSKAIQKWFLSLSEEQKFLSLRILRCGDA